VSYRNQQLREGGREGKGKGGREGGKEGGMEGGERGRGMIDVVDTRHFHSLLLEECRTLRGEPE